MKLTKQQLKQIIKEEMSSLLESSVPQEAKEKIFAKMKKTNKYPKAARLKTQNSGKLIKAIMVMNLP